MTIAILFLGAGYGTRLQRDVVQSSEHSNLLGVPKALVPLGRYNTLLDYWISRLEHAGCHNLGIDIKRDCFIVTNEACHSSFVKWANAVGFPQSHICNDGTTTNETRLGAVGDMQFALKAFHLVGQRDVLIVAGDTVFYNDFDLAPLITKFQSTNGCLVTHYKCTDKETRKTGILEVDDTGKVVAFVEKPEPTATESRKACPCFYFLKADSLKMVGEFLQEHRDQPLGEKDASGKYLAWLIQKYRVYATEIPGRLEVGDLPSYIEANKYYS